MTTTDIRHGNYQEVLEDVRADLIITSPPYNIGSRCDAKTGYRKNGGYDPKSYRAIREYSDNLPEEKYQESQLAFLHWAADHLTENGTLVYNHKPRRRDGRLIHPMLWISQCTSLVLMEEITWDRCSTHNHCPQMLWQHTERLYVLRREEGKYSFYNSKSLPHRSDLWRVPREAPNGHNAPFPLALAEAIIETWGPENGLVCDPHLGSGTSAVAAANTGRNFVGAERLKKYVNQAQRRLCNESRRLVA